jgi:hypothetical protein
MPAKPRPPIGGFSTLALVTLFLGIFGLGWGGFISRHPPPRDWLALEVWQGVVLLDRWMLTRLRCFAANTLAGIAGGVCFSLH